MTNKAKTFSGIVTSGKGIEAKYKRFSNEREKFQKVMGIKLFPGTLNLKNVTPPFYLKNKINCYLSGISPATFNELNIFLHQWPKAKASIIHLLSDKHLRALFQLEDGDLVNFTVQLKYVNLVN